MSVVLTRGPRRIYQERRRDPMDGRRFVAWAVYSYYDDAGIEYRRSFTARPETSPETFDGIASDTITIPE